MLFFVFFPFQRKFVVQIQASTYSIYFLDVFDVVSNDKDVLKSFSTVTTGFLPSTFSKKAGCSRRTNEGLG